MATELKTANVKSSLTANVDIRLLDAKDDLNVHEAAWRWLDDTPRWFRESSALFKESWDDYLSHIPKELHYGVFVDREPSAIIRLIEDLPWVFQLHLSAKRKTDPMVILQAGTALRDFLFAKGVKAFYGFIAKQNRGVRKLYEGLGFADTGVRCFKGHEGKVWELIQYGVKNKPLLNQPK
jgi:hypothetical protein